MIVAAGEGFNKIDHKMIVSRGRVFAEPEPR